MRIENLGPATSAGPARGPGTAPAPGAFADALAQAGQGLRLSRHAQKRVERRDLDLDPGRIARLNTAITRAAEKGARQSVVMLDDLAVVVDVRERTVVTAMQQGGGRERVFTNIDSVVIA
jgi:flagellar operon protein